jgi:hypothetical protein
MKIGEPTGEMIQCMVAASATTSARTSSACCTTRMPRRSSRYALTAILAEGYGADVFVIE